MYQLVDIKNNKESLFFENKFDFSMGIEINNSNTFDNIISILNNSIEKNPFGNTTYIRFRFLECLLNFDKNEVTLDSSAMIINNNWALGDTTEGKAFFYRFKFNVNLFQKFYLQENKVYSVYFFEVFEHHKNHSSVFLHQNSPKTPQKLNKRRKLKMKTKEEKEFKVAEDIKLLNKKFWKDKVLMNGFKQDEFFELPFSQILKTYNGYKETIFKRLKEIAFDFHSLFLTKVLSIDVIDGKVCFDDNCVKETFNRLGCETIKVNDTVYNIDLKLLSCEIRNATEDEKKDLKRKRKGSKTITINIAYALNNNIISTETITIPGYCDNIEGRDVFLAADFKPKRNNEYNLLPNYIYDDVVERTFGDTYKYDSQKDVVYGLGTNIYKAITYFNNKKDKIKEGTPLIAGLKTVKDFNCDKPDSITYEEYLRTIAPENNCLFFDCFKYVFTTFRDFVDVVIKYNHVINMIEERENKPEYGEKEAMAVETIKVIVLEINKFFKEKIHLFEIAELNDACLKDFILQLYLKFVENMDDGYDENFVDNLEALIQTLQTYTKDRHNITLSVDNLKKGSWLKPYWVTDIAFLLDDEQRIKELTKEDILDED